MLLTAAFSLFAGCDARESIPSDGYDVQTYQTDENGLVDLPTVPSEETGGATTPPSTAPPTTTTTTTTAAPTTTTTTTTTAAPTTTTTAPPTTTTASKQLDVNGTYTTKDDVALYIHLYGELPQNFITKREAQALGWSGGGLDKYAYGKCIGGDRFGNYEGLLPKASGRSYTECDIDTLHAKSRGAKRIVFSNDGLIYYTDNHYESFTRLY
ncbi:MAG: hypothetical protein J6L81_01270 [Clostridia bacterium]|nr:hypothetical protein [Clostridia bacterium]